MTKKSSAMGASLLIAGSIALALAAPLAASAHNEVIATSPTPDQVLTELPDSFFITTNEPMLELEGSNGFAIRVRDAAGLYYGDGCVTVVDATMSAEPALGAAGDYTMLWQAVSADGHTIDGEIPFSWQPAAGVDASAQGSVEPPVCGAATPEPTATATLPPETSPPVAEEPASSGIDLVTVLWIGGVVVAIGIAIAVAIYFAGRRKNP